MIIKYTLLILITIGIYHFVFHFKNRIGVVNTTMVLKESQSFNEKIKSFEKTSAERKNNLDTLYSEMQRLMIKYEKLRGKEAKNELQECEIELKHKQEEFQYYSNTVSESNKKDEAKVIQEALMVINKEVKDYAIERGISIVYAASPNGSIAYYSDVIDISDDIIKRINN